MEILGIIPARYASTRFPGKPLVEIKGKPMIQHVYEKASEILSNVVVATDDEKIKECVMGFNGNVVMTSVHHNSGTSRCIEAYNIFCKTNKDRKVEIIVNIQGDEPTLKSQQLKELISCFEDKKTEIATLIKKTTDIKEVLNTNIVKVVFNNNNYALYFSRSPIPFVRDKQKEEWGNHFNFFKHIGIYGFRADVLQQLDKLQASNLEKAESLEQLNWIFHGFTIKVKETIYDNIGIDTPEDLEMLVKNNKI